MRVWYWGGAIVLTCVALGIAYLLRPAAGPRILTAPIERKMLQAVVTATGTVNPQDTISVGTQVSGTIQTIRADYNDRVREGQVLASLDPTLFQAALDQADGSLAQARAQWRAALANASGASSSSAASFASAAALAENVRVARVAVIAADANVAKAHAALDLARMTVARDRALLDKGYIAQSQHDADEVNRVSADTGLRSAMVAARQARMQLRAAQSQAAAGNAQGSAAIAQAKGFAQTASAELAAVETAQAQARQAETNLQHTVITSPVNGTVIARNVSIGQTVAASFQTPTLYTIAKDLTKMEIDVAVGEPDVGSVRMGQDVDFTVLAYPNHTFHGKVAQVRENPTTIQNVVTYDTVVYERNADGRLRPGMTANASIIVARMRDALVVPVAALSFLPPGGAAHPQASAGPNSVWGNTGVAGSGSVTPGSLSRIYLFEGKELRRISVRIVLVSGGEAAIAAIGATLKPGERVAISTATQANQIVPRAPRMFR